MQQTFSIIHCGFVMDVGSRDEQQDEMGMAHFIEHMLFKGTSRRKAIHILNRLEFVGGELNAYTTKDKTCVFAAVGAPWFARAADLLFDVVFHSEFPAKEMEKEKKVIHEEIDMYLDTPDEHIQDLFQEYAFPHSALGYNILGSHESVEGFTQASVQGFYKRWYQPQKMTFVYNGPKSMPQLRQVLDRLVEKIPLRDESLPVRQLFKPEEYRVFEKRIPSSYSQTHLVVGGLAYPYDHPWRSVSSLLMNILGGPGLNSRLNLAIREKHGYAYDVEASINVMRDLGQWSIYVGTDYQNLQKVERLIEKELKLLQKQPLSPLQWHRYINQIKGQIMMAEENRQSQTLLSGKLLLDQRPLETTEEVLKRIDGLRATELQACAQELFKPETISKLRFESL